MPSHTPSLSICIATYNRADYLGETLDSIVAQLTDDVELLVVDGASTDSTPSLMKGYADGDARIRYVRLPVKGGIDPDYDRSVELARGDYCWMFTDDDLLKEGAVTTILAAISKGYDLVVVNAEVRDKNLRDVVEDRRIASSSDRVFGPAETDGLIVEALYYLSFIGGVVVRRSLWLERERRAYFGTEFVHVGVLFQKPLPNGALVIAKPYIVIRSGNAQWSTRSFEIWMFKWPRLLWSFGHISDAAKCRVSAKEPWRAFAVLLRQRSLGSYTPESYRKYLQDAPAGPIWKAGARLIAGLPMPIASAIRALYWSAKNLRRAVTTAPRAA